MSTLCDHHENTTLLAVSVFALILIASVLYTKVFSGRGAFIHVGALVGTIMAVNVFGVIVPNQKKMIAQMIAGQTPDPRYGEIGKQRSVHNNYLTLPVLLMMVSQHYPFLFTHPQSWLIVALIWVIGRARPPHAEPDEAYDHCKAQTSHQGLPITAMALITCNLRDRAAAARAGGLGTCRVRRRGVDDHGQALRDVPFAQSIASRVQGAAEECRAGQRS